MQILPFISLTFSTVWIAPTLSYSSFFDLSFTFALTPNLTINASSFISPTMSYNIKQY